MAAPSINNSSCDEKLSILQYTLEKMRFKSILHIEPATLNKK